MIEEQSLELGELNLLTNESETRNANRKRSYWLKCICIITTVAIVLITCCVILMNNANHIPTSTFNTSFLQSVDWETDPCDDFYQFACGNWAAHNPRPEEYNKWGVFSVAELTTFKSIGNYFERFREDSKVPKIIQQSNIMYKSCMDSANQHEKIRNLITKYLKQFSFPDWPSLHDEYNGFGNNFDFIDSIANMQRALGVNIIFEFDVDKNSFSISKLKNKLVTVGSSALRKQIEKCIIFLKPNSNKTEVSELTNAIFRMEQKFAQIENDSFKKSQNGYHIDVYVDARINVHIKRYIDIVFEETNKPLYDYYSSIYGSSKYYLDGVSQIEKADLALFVWWKLIYELIGSIKLDGTSDDLSLSCAKYMNGIMGMHLGFAFEQPDYQTATKPKVLDMFDNIRSSFSEQISESKWIDNRKKLLLLKNIQGIEPRIGFPEHLLNDKLYEGDGELSFSPDSVLENSIVMRKWIFRRKSKMGMMRNDDWIRPPTVVNAVYDSLHNIITIPMANFQFPFFNMGMDALDYGSLGFTLGHEISHSSTENGIIYESQKQCLVDQYDSFEVPETDFRTDGTIIFDENLADNVGLRIAFQAYKKRVANRGEDAILPELKNFTHDQLFFVAYGHKRCSSYSTDGLKDFEYDVHSPYMQRVNNVVANSEEFKKAFECKQKPENPPKKSCTLF